MARERWFNSAACARAALLAVLALAFAFPSLAQSGAGLRLCNQTSFVLRAATARPDGETAVFVEGWKRIRPGECIAALPAPLPKGIYFVYARSSEAHRGGQRVWKGEFPFCVDPNGSFAIQNPSSCPAMGLEERSFRAIRIDKPSGASLTFNEPERYNKSGQSAQAAGMQRLLDDAGLDSDTVDGYLGRRSRAVIANFLKEKKLPPNTGDRDLIDIFEDIARGRSFEVGMMMCNRTDAKIMAAIARRRPDGWESRGWWSLAAGACLRTVDEGLIAAPHYVYGEMETPDGVRTLKSATTTFCTSRAKFAVLERENCAARHFRETAFVETPPPADGKLVYEFFERNFDPPRPAVPPGGARPSRKAIAPAAPAAKPAQGATP